MRLALDKQAEYAYELLARLAGVVGEDLANDLREADQSTEAGVEAQRGQVARLKEKLAGQDAPEARDLRAVADALVRKSVWIVGGDGWAYDIGFGGLDHVIASGRNVKLLVLDTEVYSNTGGQMSKATPRGAVAKFAAGGKRAPKKDLALMAMTYGSVYVARVALGADDGQVLQAFREAEAFDGPALILAYSPCIAHGYDLAQSLKQEKAAVKSGYWPLLRYNPELKRQGKNPLTLDSAAPALPLKEYVGNETRYTMLSRSDPAAARELLDLAQRDVDERWRMYQHLAALPAGPPKEAKP
jgi:pyruvate-ferredoxin/flavodoxin oxidoreductase